ncbi:MAG: hypothetical protein IKB79_03795 [Oscillospiraceae bacterium]|nr:hypothetical protein [Oscillospiraceae bacterium]
MPDINQSENRNEDQGYTPASPVKRALAWIGVVYMIILVALMTYFYFTASMLSGLGPLLTVPGLVGLGIVAIVSYRTAGRPDKKAAMVLAVVCWLLALLTLPIGIAGLMTNFV